MKLTISKAMEYVMYLYLFVVIVSGSTGTFAVKVVRLLIAAVLVLYLIFGRSLRFNISSYVVWSTVFFLYCVITCTYAFARNDSISSTITLFYIVVVNFGIYQFLSHNLHLIINVMKCIIFSSFAMGLYIYLRYGFLVFFSSRGTATVGANLVGFYCVVATVLSLFIYFYQGKKILYLFFSMFNFIFMILSASRKAVIFLPLFLILYWIFQSNNPIKLFRNVLIAAFLLVIVWSALKYIPFLYEMVGHRIDGMINGFLGEGDSDGSTATRLSLIEFGMEYFWKRPWFGYGMDGFRSLAAVYRSWGTAYYAHNNYVELLVDCGIFGTVIYYSLYLKMLVDGIKQIKYKHPIKLIALAFLLGFLLIEYGMVTYSLAIYQLLLLVFYLILKTRNMPSSFNKVHVLKKGEVM